MKFFGEPYPSREAPAPVYAENEIEETDTPIDDACFQCEEKIVEGDRGFILYGVWANSDRLMVFHHRCWIRSITGGDQK